MDLVKIYNIKPINFIISESLWDRIYFEESYLIKTDEEKKGLKPTLLGLPVVFADVEGLQVGI